MLWYEIRHHSSRSGSGSLTQLGMNSCLHSTEVIEWKADWMIYSCSPTLIYSGLTVCPLRLGAGGGSRWWWRRRRWLWRRRRRLLGKTAELGDDLHQWTGGVLNLSKFLLRLKLAVSWRRSRHKLGWHSFNTSSAPWAGFRSVSVVLRR